jgi:multidrug efflux pump subunit AcrA (membrane-fusion protein)
MRDAKLVVGLLLLAGAGCASRGGESRDAAPRGPVAVQVVTLQPATVARVVEQPGTVRADEHTQLFVKVPGYVEKLRADIGQEVKKGELLAALWAPELEEESKQKEALIQQAAAELRQAVKAEAAARARVLAKAAMVREAKAGLGRADALVLRWRSESGRMTGLTKRGVIDAQSRDEVDNQYKAALAGRDEAKARVGSADAAVTQSNAEQEKAVADVGGARARLGVAQAAARQARVMLDYLEVRAPFDGVVTHRQVNTGDLLQPGPGKAVGVFTVARLDPVRVVVAVPEADAALVRPGTVVKLTLPALRPAAREGKVTRTSWALDPQSRTLQAEIDLPNKDRLVRPGMYVTASLTARVPAATTLPAAAVARQGDDLVAYRVEGGKAVQVVLRTGLRDERHVEVLQYRRPGDVVWATPTGRDEFVGQLTAELSDGASLEVR